MPRVISYTRFSSRKQASGDSYRRQTEAALRWCKQKGHELDTSLNFEDLGVSAYSGANVENGALGMLLKLLESGEIEQGTILLVEALDRITRQNLLNAMALLISLATKGLTIVTLTDGKIWNKETMTDMASFMFSVVTLHRGHQESEYKSKRLQATFKQHRKAGSKQAFGSAPGWLSREDKTSPWVINEIQAESVRKVFELAAQGYGSKAIAAKANAEKWPVPTRLNATNGRWHGQMPGSLLRNRAVLGEHEHRIRTYEANSKHWEGESTGIVDLDYYPRIISNELWDRARASIATRFQMKRRDSHYYNIFSGLLYCGHCGAPVQRKVHQQGYSRAQLTCSDKIAGATGCPTASALQTDEYVLDAIFAHSTDVLGNKRGHTLQDEIAAVDAALQAKQRESERVVEAITASGGAVVALAKKARQIQEELDELDAKSEALRIELAIVNDTDGLDVDWLIEEMDYLYDPSEEARDARSALHLRIARSVETIWLWAYEVAIIKFKGKDKLVPVSLPPKKLPSRANPASKYHKPPKAKPIKPQPYQIQALEGTLQPPQPRKSISLKPQVKPYYLDDDEEVDY